MVEGESDVDFWRLQGTNRPDCRTLSAGGKPSVQVALKKLDSVGFPDVLGVVDDACDSLENRQLPSKNLVATDTRDLECLLLRSPILEQKILIRLGDAEKIATFEKQAGVTVRERLLANGLVFGRLRWLSKRKHWQIFDPSKSDDLKPEAFMDRENWSIDEERLLKKVVSKLEIANTEELRILLEILPDADPWQVCQGHDLVKILRMGLQHVLGDLKNYTEDNLTKDLRLAFHDTHLDTTQLYQNIRAWEQANAPYQVLPVH